MATGSLSQHDIPAASEAGHITSTLQANCRRWKLLDLLLMFSQLALGGLLLLCSAFAIDHWAYLILQDGSLGSFGRWLYFLVLVILYPPFCIYLIVRSLKGRINPLFVAHQIEELSPEIKNSITNFWQIRSSQSVHPSILESMAQRACLDLEDGRAEDGVDTTDVSFWGYSSLGCLVITGIYFAMMPNPSLQTIHRILLPWDSVQRPSEIVIESVNPGDATITYGSTFQITAELNGTDNDTPVFLVTESEDGSTALRKLPMLLNQGRYQILLNDGPLGIQRNFNYWVEAGNTKGRTAISEQFQVTVKPAAAIGVTRVEYEFPRYTGLPNAVNSRQFNVDAIEGTTIKITALANENIKAAWLKLRTESDSTEQRTMTIQDQRNCEAEFELRVDASQSPTYVGYQVFFRTNDGKTNPEAIEYSINTLTDLSPVIEFTKPAQRELRRGPIELPANQAIQLAWSAHDPDYQLSSVAMVVTAQHQNDLRIELLTANGPDDTSNRFATTFTPNKHEFEPGTRVTIYGEAADNRKTTSNPQPNRTQSELLVIHITEPVESEDGESPNEMPENAEMQDSPAADMPDKNMDSQEEKSDPSEDKESDSGEGMTGGAGEKPEEDGDPDINNNDGAGGQAEASNEPNESNGANSPDGGGDTSEEPNNANSEDGMSNDQDNGNAKPENSDEASSSDNESDAGPSSNKSGNGDGETTNDDPASNEDSSNGNPTGESGENNATKNEPVRGSNSKSDDQHDGDIFEKLLDRLREEQSQKQQGTTPPSKQEPVEGNTDAANNQDVTENSGKQNENQPSSREGETQANAQTNSDDPQTGNPLNPKQPNNQKGVDPDAKGTSTKDPMKDPRDGNAGNEGEQVRDDGGSETTGKTGGSESGNSGVGETMDPNGENTTNTPGSEDGMGTSGSTESNIGLQANPQSGTGQKDASPTDELGLPEEVEDTEQARLEYTRKATDLALKYLRNHQDNPSDELLEDLGITAEQLREMVSRYEQLKQDNTQAGKETLYDTLKSLGLQPSTNTKGRRVKINPKDVNGVSGGGALSGLPPHLQQRFKSFRKGATVSDE